MKKLIKCILIAVCLILSAAVTAAAEDNAAEAYFGKAIIDGIMDDCYNTFSPISTDVLVTGYTNFDGSRARVYVTWDYDGLNVYAEVEEATPNVASSYDYERDGIEFFTDEDLSKSPITDDNDTQYRVTMAGESAVSLAGDWDFAYAVRNTDTGYAVEARLPWREIIPNDGHIMGFDVAVNDANNEMKRDSVRQWNSSTKSNYKNTSAYGKLKLVCGDGYTPWNKTDDLRLTIDSYRVDCGAGGLPVIGDTTFAPMRILYERLGAQIAWNEDEMAVYAIGNDTLMKVKIGDDTAYINNAEVPLEMPARLIDGKTMVPLRFVAESLKANVVYDDYQGLIKITTK